MPSTKIDVNHNTIGRVGDLDEFARVLFPGNKNHQKVFLAVFVELKYAEGGMLPKLDSICEDYGVSVRVLEIVRAKMRRMGLIDHVSRFNRSYGYRGGVGAFQPVLEEHKPIINAPERIQRQKERRAGEKRPGPVQVFVIISKFVL